MVKAVAFVTYNAVGDGLSSGWHGSPGRRALVLQNTKGDGSLYNGSPIGAAARREQSSILWGQLQEALPELDHVVVYVGTEGSERAIALAAELTADKVTFVGCDCGLVIKTALIAAAGLIDARLVLCECGGHRTMRRLYDSFMETGELLALEPA